MGDRYDAWRKATQAALDESRNAGLKASDLLKKKGLIGQHKRNQEAKRLQMVSDKAWARYERLKANPPDKDK